MGARAAAAAALAVAALTILAAPGGQASETRASVAADCVPVQHSKKVVKRVKVRRHGKLVKVKRKKTVRWETCEQPPAPATPTALAPCPEASSSVGVTARDQSPAQPRYSLSRLCVNAGTVHVELVNEGEDPHQLFIRPLGSLSTEPTYRIPDTPPDYELEAWDGMGPAPTAEADVAVTPGTWYLWCDIDTHEQLGMSASLQVR